MAGSDFDDRAATWDDDPDKVERARVTAEVIRGAVPLRTDMRLLEYGAGTGLVTEALQDSVGPVTLADPSSGMCTVLRAKVDAGAIADGNVWETDFVTDTVPDERFDVIVTVMALHHVPETGPVLESFARLLEPGGYLCVADLEKEDGTFHSHRPDFDGHDGFDRGELTRQLEAAGFTDVRFEPCHEIVRPDGRFPLFLATSRR